MASKGNEIIRIRNEGAVAYDAMIKEHGYEAARQMLIDRVGARCNIAIKPDEYNKSVEAVQQAVINTYLAVVYTTLHDVCGYGKTRLHRFKKHFDELTAVCYVTDQLGRRYCTIKDCAEELNKLYDMGLDVQTIDATESSAEAVSNRVASVTSILNFLRKHGEDSAADLIWKDVYGINQSEAEKVRTKEQRAIAKRRKREDRRYQEPNMNMFDPEVVKCYFSLFAKALIESAEATDEQVSDLCGTVNGYLQNVLDGGKAVMDGIQKELEEQYGIAFE